MTGTTYLCVTVERLHKSRRLMLALADGLSVWKQQSKIITGAPPDDMNPFIVWGQQWLTLRIVPPALKKGRAFWYIDNGYIRSARGGPEGYYRFTYRSMSPILLAQTPEFAKRPPSVTLEPWRTEGKHILVALPGAGFGKAVGIDVPYWIANIGKNVRSITKRPIITRPKITATPLSRHLQNCWALVTHSSNVAVDAVIAGIPVFVAPTNPAAPVGRCDLDLEHPVMPDRTHWLNSIFSQQFTLDEMRKGIAHEWMMRVADQVDRAPVKIGVG